MKDDEENKPKASLKPGMDDRAEASKTKAAPEMTSKHEASQRPGTDRRSASSREVTAPKMISKTGTEGPPLPEIFPGMDLVVTKWVALEATCRLAQEYMASLKKGAKNHDEPPPKNEVDGSLSYVSADEPPPKNEVDGPPLLLPLPIIEQAQALDRYLDLRIERKVANERGILLRKVTDDGLYGALWELAEEAGLGVEVVFSSIPILQETVELCNHCDINPYRAPSGGMVLMATFGGAALVGALAKSGVKASVIGCLSTEAERVILMKDRKQFLTPPR